MLRSVHMKLVMIMVLLILSLMTVVGTFLMRTLRLQHHHHEEGHAPGKKEAAPEKEDEPHA